MGLFHCIESSCARVRYSRYELIQNIRYRYDGEDWQTVEGDNYQTNNGDGQCPTGQYIVNFKSDIIDFNGDIAINNRSGGIAGLNNYRIGRMPYLRTPYSSGALRYSNVCIDFVSSAGQTITRCINTPLTNAGYSPDGVRDLEIKRYLTIRGRQIEVADNCGECEFTVFKDGNAVFSRSEQNCPEVEILDPECRLSDRVEVIEIEKSPYLQRIELRNQSIELTNFGLIPLIRASDLEPNTLNIYRTFVSAPPSISNNVPAPGVINPYEFIAQISSDEDCPPPEFEVICDCPAECPEGTCAVTCGNFLCCYDNTGRAVESIPLTEFASSNAGGAG